MGTPLPDPRFFIDAVQFVGMGLLAFGQWARRPGEDAKGELPKIRDRLAALEEAAKHAASKEAVAQLQSAISETSVRLEGIQDSLRRRDVQMDRIENYLLTNTK